jgi:hypothetical protein
MTAYTFNQLFDFTRTTSATFVGSNGLIQTTPASVNLLTFTQEFDNAVWTKSNATVTANVTTAPDGTLTADKLIDNATNGGHNTSQSCSLISGVSYTLSAYVKKDDLSFCAIGVYDAATKYQTFDLNTGCKGTSSGITGSTIDPVGNGWYRVSVTFVAAITGTCYATVYLLNSTTFAGYVGSGTGVFTWGAQVEAGSTATEYTRNNGGVYPARFDYDPVTLAPKGILIEEQRTNLQTYSAEFDNAAWTKVAASVSANTAVAPSGATVADTLIENTANSIHAALQGTTRTAGVATYTFSVFFKALGTNRYIRILISDGPTTNYSGAFVDPVTGTIVGSVINVGFTAGSVTITPVGNGWYRGVVTATTDAVSTGLVGQVYLATTASVTSYTGDGTSGVYLWGAQLEAGAFATSYIPTVASQVTRSPDICNIVAPMFAPWYNQSEGTFVVSFDTVDVSTYAAVVVAFTDLSNRIDMGTGTLIFRSTVANGGVTQADLASAGTTVANVVNTGALAYKINDFASTLNGGGLLTDTSGTLPSVSRLDIGNRNNDATLQLNGHIRSIRYFPFRASNNQLQVLST